MKCDWLMKMPYFFPPFLLSRLLAPSPGGGWCSLIGAKSIFYPTDKHCRICTFVATTGSAHSMDQFVLTREGTEAVLCFMLKCPKHITTTLHITTGTLSTLNKALLRNVLQYKGLPLCFIIDKQFKIKICHCNSRTTLPLELLARHSLIWASVAHSGANSMGEGFRAHHDWSWLVWLKPRSIESHLEH